MSYPPDMVDLDQERGKIMEWVEFLSDEHCDECGRLIPAGEPAWSYCTCFCDIECLQCASKNGHSLVPDIQPIIAG